ncbi:hybrid sensor histidine kinase/response regulator [Planctomycetes bacterium K23_9]|uniref:histidine kinase n=1 Tax=Stieleria marina TaxID=1930275 RepID=A0A517NYE1_9BACT|nr:Sensor histidine kinase TodS [Planctomycetes bacterium K23_9]
MPFEGQTSILLIEDDSLDAEIVQRAFRDAETKIVLNWATTLQGGIEQLLSNNFDVILSDLGLPDSNEDDTIPRLRRHAAYTPIVVLTGSTGAKLSEKLLADGADEYLVKDEITPAGLKRAIENSVRRHEKNSQVHILLAEVKAQSQALKEKNAKLAKLYDQAHEFVDNVSHEFRTPLTVVKEYISLVREGLAGPVNPKQQKMLSVAEDRADDLNTMVDDMLDISKLEAGMLGAWRKNCVMDDIAHRVRNSLTRKSRIKDVSLCWELPNGLPEVYCDAEKVGRVITNLATNAIKFCGNPGIVKIGARADFKKKEMIVWIHDNGPGIPPDKVTEIFSRFKQLGQSVRSSTKGFGLGLNIAKALVSLNFGEMDVTSEVGSGSVFTFTIPFADPVEVMHRYIDNIDQINRDAGQADGKVSLVYASIPDQTGDSVANELDAFLNYCLRRNDVLFRLSPSRWAIALPETHDLVGLFIKRVQTERVSVNRNRPHGPLPKIDLRIDGTWETTDQRNDLIDALQIYIERNSVAHA